MKRKFLTVLTALVLALLILPVTANASEENKNAESLSKEEQLEEIIEEGKEKLGMELSKEDAQKLVDAMEQLENVGFSTDYVIEKAEELYRQYGEKFIDHVDEAVTDAVQGAASNAIETFFENLKNSIKRFFENLFA
ncbi:MAG: hypothetical protein PUG54_05425 [Firmicutes bacterium]|nr:hypothetical protein [Bacillota bacterium]